MANPLQEIEMQAPPRVNPVGFIPAAEVNVEEARPFPALEDGEIYDDIDDEEGMQYFLHPYEEEREQQEQQEAFDQGMKTLCTLTQEANKAIRKLKTFLLLNEALQGLHLANDPKIEFRYEDPDPDLGFTDVFYSSSEEEEEENGN